MTGQLKVRVVRKALVAEDICSFELALADGGVLPPFTPGAHIDVWTPSGAVRQYSLSTASTSAPASYRIAVLHEKVGRGGSRSMHIDVREGDLLTVSVPRNHFELDASGSPSLLLAGGIGITPILSMAHHLSAQGRPFSLHYATRSQARTAFWEELTGRGLRESARVYHDDSPVEKKLDIANTLGLAPDGAHLYVCGPAGFIEAVLKQARAAGWDENRLHREFFAAGPVAIEGDQAFDVVVVSTGKIVRVEADQSVTSALSAAGVDVATSCEQGICGTCVTRVLEGIPDHRDSFFTNDERDAGGQFTPCCSRAKSARLVLDL